MFSFSAYDLWNTVGGAYDTVPEVAILLALFEHSKSFYPVVFDEAGEYELRVFANQSAHQSPIRSSCRHPVSAFSAGGRHAC